MKTKMPIRAAPFKHQQEAFDFVCGLFGLIGGDAEGVPISIKSRGAALLCEMGTG